MRTVLPSPLLRTALTADAIVSGGVALLQVVAAGWLAELLLLPRALLLETGSFLVAYTILLVMLARSPRLPAAIVATVVLGNIGWAAACIGLLMSGRVSPNAFGIAFVIVQIAAVLAFAALEYAGLRSSERAIPVETASARQAR